ncbi:MAG TPA: pilus assembly protein TadG-related protein [Pyrinomonadaceae bacterium]|nr:pilus assembly protein TadG-related protein [Pyrinomonadaceae bacterium]
MKSSALEQRRRGQRGSVLAVSVFGMMAFLLAVGLCVDVSHFYVVKAELQNAADASALAGASALNSSPSGITLATERAVEAMNSYEFNNKAASLSAGDVKFAVNFDGPYMSAADAQADAENIRFVKVEIPDKDVNVLFGSAGVGDNVAQINGDAIAGMSMSPNVHCDWIPLSVIDDDANPFQPKGTYVIRGGPHNMVSPGNRQILAVAGRGGKDVKYGLAGGVDICAEPGEWYEIDTKPGEAQGAVKHGLNTRFDDYGGGLSPTEFPPDVNIKENIDWETYKQGLDPATRNTGNFEPSNPSHGGVPMRRVVLIPLIKLSEFDNGRDQVHFYKFAAFFLQTKVQNGSGDIVAEYIGERIMFGKGGFKPGGGPVTPELTQPVLYK